MKKFLSVLATMFISLGLYAQTCGPGTGASICSYGPVSGTTTIPINMPSNGGLVPGFDYECSSGSCTVTLQACVGKQCVTLDSYSGGSTVRTPDEFSVKVPSAAYQYFLVTPTFASGTFNVTEANNNQAGKGGSSGSGGGATIAHTTNAICGDNTGNGIDCGPLAGTGATHGIGLGNEAVQGGVWTPALDNYLASSFFTSGLSALNIALTDTFVSSDGKTLHNPFSVSFDVNPSSDASSENYWGQTVAIQTHSGNTSGIEGLYGSVDTVNHYGTGESSEDYAVIAGATNSSSGIVDFNFGIQSYAQNGSTGNVSSQNFGISSEGLLYTGDNAAVNSAGYFFTLVGNGASATSDYTVYVDSPSLSGSTLGSPHAGIFVADQPSYSVQTGKGIASFGDQGGFGIDTLANWTTNLQSGFQAICSDCDTPVANACTSSGDHAGAFIKKIRGAFQCS